MIYRMYEVCAAIEKKIDNDDDPAYDKIDRIYPTLEVYSSLKIQSPELKSKIINSMIVNSFVSDDKFYEISTYNTLVDYLSTKIAHVESDYTFDVYFQDFIILCNNFEYEKSIIYICQDLVSSVLSFCLSSDNLDISIRLILIANMSSIISEIKGPESGTLQNMYDGFEKIKESKISELIPKEDLQMFATMAGSFLADHGHAEVGEDIATAMMDACDETGMNAVSVVYEALSKNPQGITNLADDLVDKLNLGTVPIGDAIKTMSENVSTNSEKLKGFSSH